MPLSQSKRTKSKPHVLITIGDPSGIGPEIVLKSLNKPNISKLAKFSIIGDYYALNKAADTLNLSVERILKNRNIDFISAGRIKESSFRFGRLSAEYGLAAVKYIDIALKLISGTEANALVTAPINKKSVNEAGLKFSGHTEYLASMSKAEDFAMMLVGGRLKVVPFTRHVSLREVSDKIEPKMLGRTIKLLNSSLKIYFGIRSPRIAVCSLNPHGGEKGVFGNEEKKIIKPVIDRLCKDRISVFGPLPADTLFYQAYNGKYDAVVSMYHDQGLVPLKMIAFNCGVNTTLGLPFIRTSPDHGTAFDIAGKNCADERSMVEAIKLAVFMWHKK